MASSKFQTFQMALWLTLSRKRKRPEQQRVNAYNQLKGLILAQNERWRRGLGMQVEREGAAHHVHRNPRFEEPGANLVAEMSSPGQRRKGE